MPRVAAAIALILLVAGGKTMGWPGPPRASPQQASTAATRARTPYEIIEDVNIRHQGVNRFVSARLGSKVTEQALAEIAREIRAAEPRPYEKTLIEFSIPQQVPDGPDNGWASVDFRPELVVRIRGLTPEREERFRSVPRPSGPEVVGTWLVENAWYAQLVTIFKSGGDAWLVERSDPAEPSRRVELAEVPASSGRRFKRPGSRQPSRVVPDQLYEVAPDGILRIRVNDQLYASARPLR